MEQNLFFEGAGDRCTFSQNGVEMWYLGMATEHYRFCTVYETETRSWQVAKTIKLFPHNFPVLGSSSTNTARRAIEYLAEAVKTPSLESPFSIGYKQLRAIREFQ